MNDVIKETIENLEADILAGESWLDNLMDQFAEGTYEPQYIVGRDDIYLINVEIGEDKRLTGKHGVTCVPQDADTFSEKHAKIIAAATKNGNGQFQCIRQSMAVRHSVDKAYEDLNNWKEAERNWLAKQK